MSTLVIEGGHLRRGAPGAPLPQRVGRGQADGRGGVGQLGLQRRNVGGGDLRGDGTGQQDGQGERSESQETLVSDCSVW